MGLLGAWPERSYISDSCLAAVLLPRGFILYLYYIIYRFSSSLQDVCTCRMCVPGSEPGEMEVMVDIKPCMNHFDYYYYHFGSCFPEASSGSICWMKTLSRPPLTLSVNDTQSPFTHRLSD